MKFIVKTNSGMGNFEFFANNQEELDKALKRVEKVIKSNRYWYKYINQVFDENGWLVCQW